MEKRNIVDTWASSAKGAQYGFIKAVIYALEQFDARNNAPLTKMVALANGKVWKGPNGKSVTCNGIKLTGFASPLKRILDKALSGCELTFKDGKAKWVVKENGGLNHDVLDGLRVLAAVPNIHVGHDSFKAAFPVVKADKVVDNKAKNAARKRVHKLAEDMGMTLEAFLALCAAKDDLPEEK